MSCCDCESCNAETQILAVILDLDGTLLGTEKATKVVLKEFLEKYGKVLDCEKEDRRLGQMHKESTASIVKDYDLPLTPDQFSNEIMPLYRERWPQAKALPGANRLIVHLQKHGVPLALASNSMKKHVEAKISRQPGWKESFSVILGGDEVNSGKPSPDIFLEAAKRMGVDAMHCLVIEDSLVGVTAAKAAGMKVVAVPPPQTQADGYSIANSVLHSLLEFQPELWGLAPFDDWVDNALPIEPIFVKGQISQKSVRVVEDEGPTAPPDQLWGIYFGWAKIGAHEIFKVVASIGWDCHSGSAERVINICVIGEMDGYASDQQLLLLLVGFIRGLNSEVDTSTDLEIFEEDKSIASAALDLPMFANYMSSSLLVPVSSVKRCACCHE